MLLAIACGSGDDDSTSPLTSTPANAATSGAITPPSNSSPNGTESTAATGASGTDPAATDSSENPEPNGFPIDPGTTLGVVTGDVGSRLLVFDGTGPAARDFSANDQPADDPNRANRSGWNCRVHEEYETAPAVDFYIPAGTPILATHDGTATLYAISTVNDFERYDVSREPYLGNPDRSSAPFAPFPGRSSGLGVYVRLANEGFITGYGHLDVTRTAHAIPEEALFGPYTPDDDFIARFQDIPDPRIPVPLAEWEVKAGDVIGMSGDSGYSEGPHLHYTVQHSDSGTLLCPTTEAGYSDGGWLFK